MSVFRFGAAQSPPRRAIVQGSEQSPFCTSPSQLQEVTLDPNMNTTVPFPGRSPGKTSPLRGHALKEYEEQLAQLKKENFNLKLRIYFLEERMGRMNADDKEDIIKKNIELKVEAESLRKDVSDKQELLCHASKALELLEEQQKNKLREVQSEREVEKGAFETRIEELEKEIREYEEKCRLCESHHTQEEVNQLQHKIEELEIQVNQLVCSVRNETERANKLDVDLLEAQQEAQRLSLYCQGLETDLKGRDDQLENLRQELEQKGQDLVKCKKTIRSLEDALSAKEPEIQIKVQELGERDRIIEEKQSEIEKQNKVIIEIQITLEEKQRQIEALRSSLTAKDENIATLESRLDRAKATSQNLETKLEFSLQEVNRLREERLWAEVEEKNKKILQLTEERDALSIEMERQVQALLKRLTEKETCLEECERRLEAVLSDAQSRDNQITGLECELNELRTSLKELQNRRDAANYKEEGQQTDGDSLTSKAEVEFTRELADKQFEIERLNSELRKRTTNLQELVNKELWDKNREIEKLQDRLNLLCERKEVEIVALRQQVEARDFQLKVAQDRLAQLASQGNFSLPVVIKEIQPITLNNHLHIQPQDLNTSSSSSSGSAPSLEDEVSSLRQQLVSSVEEKKHLYQRLEELKEQLHNGAPQECDNSNFVKPCLQCTKAKQDAKRAESLHRETTGICTMLTERLEELARFLCSLLKCPGFLGVLGQRRQKILKKVLENSMELSRTLTVSFSESQEPINTTLQLNSLSDLLASASEINLSLFNLQGGEGEGETEAEISCYESKLESSEVGDNLSIDNKHASKIRESSSGNKTELIEELRSQVENLKEEIKLKDAEISLANLHRDQEDGCADKCEKIDNSSISFLLRAKGGDFENKDESDSSLSSMTFYNSRHCSNANEKWPKPLPLSLRKEDVNLHADEENERTCNGEGRHRSSPHKLTALRLSQSANTTPVKADSARTNNSMNIRRSSSANAVSGSLLKSPGHHREYGIASLSESEVWSEPDRNVSMARIGLKEDNLKNVSLTTSNLNSTFCPAGGSGRGRRSKEVDNSSESSEETARENTRTPGKRLRGDSGDIKKLHCRIRVLEQLNDALRTELNILHQLTPSKGGLKANNNLPLTRDISVNTSQVKLDKSTSVEILEDDPPIIMPPKLLEQIRYQREKLESSLLHNDFIRRQLEQIFVTLASSQGGDIGDIWQKLKETTEELCAARAKVQEMQAKVVELDMQLKDSRSKVQHLEETVEQLKVTQETVSVLKEQVVSLETKLKEKDNEILEQNCLLLESRNKGEEQLIEAKKAIEEANRSKEELERQLREVDVLLVDSERRVQEAEQQLKECELKLLEAERQKESIRNETGEKIKKIELEIFEAERRRNEAEIQVIEAKKQLQDEESRRYEAEWKLQELEEKLRLRESEYEKYFHEILDRKIKEIELRANLQIRETEKRLEQKELYHKAEAEKKIREAERLGSEFEAGLRRQIEDAERQGKVVQAEGDKKMKELEDKYKLREAELKKRIHESENNMWEKEAELRRQLDEAAMKHSQTALERTRLANEKLHLEQELRRYEAREAELIREKKEAENRLVLSQDKLDVKVLELEEKKNDLERRVRDLEYMNSELEQRLSKMHSIDNYHSQHNTSHLSGPFSSTFPYRKADTISSSSGLDTYSGDGGSLPSSIWSLPPGAGEDGKRKEDNLNLKADSSSIGLSALSTLVLQQGFSRQRSEMSDYMSEEPPVEEYETLFTQTCSSSWFSLGGHHSSHAGNNPSDSIVPRNINSSPDLGIESDQGRFSSLETSTMPLPIVHIEEAELARNPTKVGSDLEASISAAGVVSGGELETENARLLKENADLKRDLMRTRRSLQATLSQLTSSNQLKKQMEKAICRQLHKTHHILKQARRDNPEGDDIKYRTSTVENPQ